MVNVEDHPDVVFDAQRKIATNDYRDRSEGPRFTGFSVRAVAVEGVLIRLCPFLRRESVHKLSPSQVVRTALLAWSRSPRNVAVV